MRVYVLMCLAASVLPAGCDGSGEAAGTAAPAVSISATAECEDAPRLRQRAADEWRQRLATPSDQDAIVLGNRAGFFTSLALVAEFRCGVTVVEAEEALDAALAAAREADRASTFYERASRWADANLAVTRVLELMVQPLLSPPAQ